MRQRYGLFLIFRYILLISLGLIGVCSCGRKDRWEELPEIPLVEPSFNSKILSVSTVYHQYLYNAFTDLTFYEGYFYLTFRVANKHVFDANSSIVIMKSVDFKSWQILGEIKSHIGDNRDPKLFLYKDNLCLGFTEVSGNTKEYALNIYSINTENGSLDLIKQFNLEPYWHWFLDESHGNLLSLGYNSNSISFFNIDLKNGSNKIYNLNLPNAPSEARFVEDNNSLYSLIRTNYKALLSISDALDLQKTIVYQLPVFQMGGPNIKVFNNDNLVFSGRELLENKNYNDFVKTSLFFYNKRMNYLSKILELPSSLDNGYPGLVIKNDTIFVTYYDTHEATGKAVIKSVIIEVNAKD